jgi:hypothetical protein
MRSFFFLAVAAVALAFLTADDAQAGGRRARYYSYGVARPTVSQPATSQARPSNMAQSNTIRRYSYAPSTSQSSTTRYSYSPANNGRRQVMGTAPYGASYWRADRKVLGY